MLGFIRPEYNYASLGALHVCWVSLCSPADSARADALIKDINHDKVVAATSVQRPAYSAYSEDAFFSKPTDLAPLPAGEDPSRPREKPQQP